jgi:hypothetical protein
LHNAEFFRDVYGAVRLLGVLACCLLALEQKGMSDAKLSESDRRNAVAVRTLQEKNRDAIRWDASGHNIEAVALHHDYGKALPKLLEDLGDFPELDVTSKALPREEDLDAICRLTFLKSLAISGDRVTDDVIPRLTTLVGLRTLRLGYSALTGETLSRLAALPDLACLDLTGLAALPPVAAQELLKIRSLRQLYVSQTPLTDADVEVLVQHKEWRRLTFDRTSVTDTSLQLVAGLPHLTHFDVDGECITSAGIKALAASQSLEWLDLRFCPSLDDAAVDALADMPKLRTVKLHDKNKITPAAVKRLAKKKPKLLIQHPATNDWERHGWNGFFE